MQDPVRAQRVRPANLKATASPQGGGELPLGIPTVRAQGQTWVVDADLKGYFDSIPQDKLLNAVRKKIADGRVLRLLEKYLQQGVLDSGKDWQPTEQGTPQGAVISPLLANIYLDPLDQQMAGRGREMIRYADDFIMLCRSQTEAEEALAEVAAWVKEAGLVLHPQKTRIVDASQPGRFDFHGTSSEAGNGRARKAWSDSRKCCATRPRAPTEEVCPRLSADSTGDCAAGRATSPAGTGASTLNWTNGCG